jgi:hypothetical protein
MMRSGAVGFDVIMVTPVQISSGVILTCLISLKSSSTEQSYF